MAHTHSMQAAPQPPPHTSFQPRHTRPSAQPAASSHGWLAQEQYLLLMVGSCVAGVWAGCGLSDAVTGGRPDRRCERHSRGAVGLDRGS
jgi:hypothetical protein